MKKIYKYEVNTNENGKVISAAIGSGVNYKVLCPYTRQNDYWINASGLYSINTFRQKIKNETGIFF